MSTIPMSKAKTHLARLLNEVQELGERVTITRSGRPVAVLLAVEEYEALLETLEVLAENELTRAVEEGLDDVQAGRVVSHEDVWAEAGE